MRMVGARVHLQLRELLATEGALREHATHRVTHRISRFASMEVSEGLAFYATRVARVGVDHLALSLVRGHDDFVGVNDDHVVTGVDVWRKNRLVLTT